MMRFGLAFVSRERGGALTLVTVMCVVYVYCVCHDGGRMPTSIGRRPSHLPMSRKMNMASSLGSALAPCSYYY
jgi:hypothetical protein